jgi:hypothetical protein
MTDQHQDTEVSATAGEGESHLVRLGRRALMLGAATGAGVAVGTIAGTEPAGAANGHDVILGETNVATAPTSITNKKTTSLVGACAAPAGDNKTAIGVNGTSTNGYGVRGDSEGLFAGVGGYASGNGASGVYGQGTGPNGYGVYGLGTVGVYGASSAANDPRDPKGDFGVEEPLTACGVYGNATGSGGYAVYGDASAEDGTGVFGNATGQDGSGVFGWASGANGYGVHADATGNGGYGLYGTAYGANGIGVYALQGPSASSALYADGNATVTGTLSKGGGSFKIDHPLDPAGKYLYHSFVESPDMMNIYNGTIVLDCEGRARVELPEWFEALNRDFRYSLTALDAPAPNLHIASRVAGGGFSIAGGNANQEVSWQVTGIRQDAFANAHRIPVEVDKPAEDRGCYLHPELFGKGEEHVVAARARARSKGRPRDRTVFFGERSGAGSSS